VPRYLVTTRRALRGRVASAYDAVRDAAGVQVIDARDPEMVTIETSEETAAELMRKLAATHFVDPEIHHRLH
jgi:hypothetical protein